MDYVGMDIGKRQSQLCWLTGDGEIRHERINTTREVLNRRFSAGYGRVLMESCAPAEWIARTIEGLGTWEVVVADPNFAPMYAERTRRVKTDRRDAEALVWACVKGNYKRAHRLSDSARRLRMSVSIRKRLVRARASSVVQLKAMLAAEGISTGSGTAAGLPMRLMKIGLPPGLNFELAPLVDHILHLNAAIAMADEALEDLTKSHPDIGRLMTVPSVGPVTAATWVATLDTPARFGSGEQVVAYLGLAPGEWSSSETKQRGSITKAGPKELREMLIESAWRVINLPSPESEALRQWALAVAERRHRNKAAVALARKLARILFVIWRDGTTYVPAATREADSVR